MKLLLCFLAVTCCARAGEYVVLSSGFRIHADSHMADGNMMRLQTSQGEIEIPASSVTGIEKEEYTPPPPAASKPLEQPKATPDGSPQELVTRAAIDAGLPPEFVHSIARAESAYKTDAVSPKGAIGLMQLMPKTAAELNANPYDPAQNAEAGAQYLRELLLKYQNDPHQVLKAIAAYNAGPAAVDKYKGIPPYAETVEYVRRVLKEYERQQKKNSAD
ncbi:MAG TPA: lytic transglycosylase domain-containing protein [Bryobacteraceae bacterium]|nr:lytic transglycosylase domain-containing protein [Bryobacteraceae bacterium]